MTAKPIFLCLVFFAHENSRPISSPNSVLVPTLSSKLFTGAPLKNGENTISDAMTYVADALYMLHNPKTVPTTAACETPNMQAATRIGIYAVVMDIGGR